MGHFLRSLSSEKVNLTQQDSQALACPQGWKTKIPFLGLKHREHWSFPWLLLGIKLKTSIFAPLAISLLTISCCLFWIAKIRGVSFLELIELISAPFSSKIVTISELPIEEAMWRAVFLSWSVAWRLASLCISWVTDVTRPFEVALRVAQCAKSVKVPTLSWFSHSPWKVVQLIQILSKSDDV